MKMRTIADVEEIVNELRDIHKKGNYGAIMLNRKTGQMWIDEFVDENSAIEYEDRAVVRVLPFVWERELTVEGIKKMAEADMKYWDENKTDEEIAEEMIRDGFC